MLSLEHYLGLSAVLFTIGLVGMMVHRRNMIILLACLELLLLAVNTNLVAFSQYTHHVHGEAIVLIVMAIAAAEAVIGLALLVIFYRQHRSIDLQQCAELKG